MLIFVATLVLFALFGEYPWFPLPSIAGLFILLAIAIELSNKDTLLFLILSVIAFCMIVTWCFASYGIIYVWEYVAGMVLTLVTFCFWKKSEAVKNAARVSMGLMVISSFCFVPYCHYASYGAIAISVVCIAVLCFKKFCKQ